MASARVEETRVAEIFHIQGVAGRSYGDIPVPWHREPVSEPITQDHSPGSFIFDLLNGQLLHSVLHRDAQRASERRTRQGKSS